MTILVCLFMPMYALWLLSDHSINKNMAVFHIQHLDKKSFIILNDSKSKQYLAKWSLWDGLLLSSWSFNKPYEPHRIQDLITSVLTQATRLRLLPSELEVSTFVLESVACSVTSNEFFDRLLDSANGIVNRSGDGGIRGCFEEYIGTIAICDELRQMLLNEDGDTYPLYSKAERRELLFLLLHHLAVGGQWCQYEDFIQPYIDMAVLMYKNILSVQKNKDTGMVEIRSKCFRVNLKPELSPHDFIYAIIDAGLREVTLLSHITK